MIYRTTVAGKEDAHYLIIDDGECHRAVYSDAMEPEDATFHRDLKWIATEINRAYLFNRASDENWAAVHCRGDSTGKSCGMVVLTRDQYGEQMMSPNSLWCCPNCGSTASFSDDYYETVHGIS